MKEIRVNLGCGLGAVEGWDNLDRSPNLLLDRVRPVKLALRRSGVLSDAHMAPWPRNIVRHDIRRRLPYNDGTVSAIYSSHALEHLYLDQARAVLRECRRVLLPRGIIRLAMPDGEQLASNLVNGVTTEYDDPGLEFNRRLCAHPFARPTVKARLLSPFASGPHRWQPTPSLLRSLLIEAGFVDIEQRSFRVGRLPELELVKHRTESIFVEAFTPAPVATEEALAVAPSHDADPLR